MIARIGLNDDFPPTAQALSLPNGLLAESDDLTPELLLRAYRRGIFPWNSQPPIRWWTPDPRSVLIPAEFHLSRSLRKVLRRDRFRLSVDQLFPQVMTLCALTRIEDSGLSSMDRNLQGTWLGPEMIEAYTVLHQRGYAHSIESYDPEGNLVGGLYGVAIGRAFFGESMFSLCSNASRVAFCGLMHILRRGGYGVVDCQMETAFLNSFGAKNVSRLDFEKLLDQTIDQETGPAVWQLPATSGGLF